MRFALMLLVGLALVGCSAREDSQPGAVPPGHAVARATFHTDSGDVRTAPLEVADSPDERERGLMDRTELAEDSGMVFLFDAPTDVGFWMKDTVIPLSIAFWDERARVVDVLEMPPCTTDACPVYRSQAPYVAALEMSRGWFAEHGVQIGDEVDLQVGTG